MTNAEAVFGWFSLDSVKKYYKHGELYGLIGTKKAYGMTIICASVQNVDDHFTKDMLKDIILLYNTQVICLITDVESKQELIRRVLSRYDFNFTYHNKIMYSTGGKTWQSEQ